MSIKHSKGPWRLDGPDWYGDYNILPAHESLAVGAITRNGFRSAEETLANAHLAVTAPELLECLKDARRLLTDQDAIDLAHIDSVIAKAEGGAL